MLEKQLSPIANYGGSSGTAKVHIEDFESLRNQGVDATLPGKYKKCLSGAGRKNQLLVEISWSDDSSSKIQRKLAKMAKKHYRKNADKARTLQRKEERKAKKYSADSVLESWNMTTNDCIDCIYYTFCENYDGEACKGYTV